MPDLGGGYDTVRQQKGISYQRLMTLPKTDDLTFIRRTEFGGL